MAVRYVSISSFDGTSDDNGLAVRLFGTDLFVVDSLVMMFFAPTLFLVMVL